jgi:hypothetical protein
MLWGRVERVDFTDCGRIQNRATLGQRQTAKNTILRNRSRILCFDKMFPKRDLISSRASCSSISSPNSAALLDDHILVLRVCCGCQFDLTLTDNVQRCVGALSFLEQNYVLSRNFVSTISPAREV